MEDNMLLETLCTGEELHRYKKSLVLLFNGPRKVLSTAAHNGGYREGLTAVFNNDGTVGAGMAAILMAPTYQEHVALLATQLGLDPDTTAGITTAAQMENVSIKAASHGDLTVTAIVTGGVEVNGGRAGDPATWDELADEAIEAPAHGTINIILHIDADLTPGALARALVTCTEAKSVALQELQAPSRYSSGLATGSGTDGTIIVARADSSMRLTNAGKHSKLGEMIGVSVKQAVTEALGLQSGLTPTRQHDAIKRLERYGVSEDWLYTLHCAQVDGQQPGLSDGQQPGRADAPLGREGGPLGRDGVPLGLTVTPLGRAQFADRAARLLREGPVVTLTSLVAHLLDQMLWGLIDPAEAAYACDVQLAALGMEAVCDRGGQSASEALHRILTALGDGLARLVGVGDGLPDGGLTGGGLPDDGPPLDDSPPPDDDAPGTDPLPDGGLPPAAAASPPTAADPPAGDGPSLSPGQPVGEGR
jgi:adenosylcobinamide amidohydrolase